MFDFFELTGDIAERELEQALLDRTVDALHGLGGGFAFVGRQMHVDGDNSYADFIFSPIEQLRCLVIEQKTSRLSWVHRPARLLRRGRR